MQAIYEVKKHISYEKREQNDKVMGLMMDKLTEGQTNKRIQQEEKAMNNYIKNKEFNDMVAEKHKTDKLKQRRMKRRSTSSCR